MSTLKIDLLGETHISAAEQANVLLPTRKAKALLIFLATSPGVARSRDLLAGLLWSRNDETQARTNLRQTLSRLKKALGDAGQAVVADAHEIKLMPDMVGTDLCAFERHASKTDVASWETAAAIFRGEFAAGFNIGEPDFENWIASERRRISEIAIGLLGRLLTHYEANECHDHAASTAAKLLVLDPLQETAHQSLMLALANLDRYEAAMQQYRICRDLLRKELGVEPSENIRSLNEDIARRRLTVRHAPMAPAVEAKNLFRSVDVTIADNLPTAPNLPPQLKGLNLGVPQRPSIVILPFNNLTPDTEQDHFAEGIRVDIQSALVKISGIFLIAAGSGNAMRGHDAKTAGDALGVRYVLQGSIRRSGSQLRITAELIDVIEGNTVWMETFDRQFSDGFEVQDEIVENIVTALDVKLLRGEQAAVWHKTLTNRDSLESFYKGVREFFKMRKDSMARARQSFEAVDRMQPEISTGATWVALCHWFDAFKGWTSEASQSLQMAGDWATKAVSMDDPDGQAHMVLSYVHLMNRRFDDALIVGRQAVQLRPNCTNANGFFANVLHFCGEQHEAINHVTWAIRYSPIYPPFFADVLSQALLFNGDLQAAISVANESLRINPQGQSARLVMIAAMWELGEREQARKAGQQLLTYDPTFSIQHFSKLQPYRNSADLQNYVAKIKSAGLAD